MDKAYMPNYSLRICLLFFQAFCTSCLTTTEQTVVEGSDLFCYECRENYKKGYDPLNSPCLNNASVVNIRQCLPEHKYCQVERITVDGWSIVLSIERSCTSECLYGCRYNGYGVTYERCYSCCRTKNCNTDNGAPCSGLHSPLLAVFNTLAVIVLNNTPVFRLNF